MEVFPAEGRISEKPHANENEHVRQSVGQLVTLKITARESKTREIWQSDGAQIFLGGSYDVSHQFKT